MSVDIAAAAATLLRQMSKARYALIEPCSNGFCLRTHMDRRRRGRQVHTDVVRRLQVLDYLTPVTHGFALSHAGFAAARAEDQERPSFHVRWVMDEDGQMQRLDFTAHENPLVVIHQHYRAGRLGGLLPRELAAGERLRADVALAGFHASLTVDLSRVGASGYTGSDLSERRLDARRRVMTALSHLDMDARSAVVAVCVEQVELRRAEGLVGLNRQGFRQALQRGLGRLADDYGLGDDNARATD